MVITSRRTILKSAVAAALLPLARVFAPMAAERMVLWCNGPKGGWSTGLYDTPDPEDWGLEWIPESECRQRLIAKNDAFQLRQLDCLT